MMYFRARFYIPEIGRFIQEDPHPGRLTNPGSSINKYIYVQNNPTNYVDPEGRIGFFAAVLIFTAVQSVVEAAFEGGSFFENLERKSRSPFSGKPNEGSFFKNLALNYVLFSVSGITPGFNQAAAGELGLIAATTHFDALEREYGYGHNVFGGIKAGQISDAITIGKGISAIKSGIDASREAIKEAMLSILIGVYVPVEGDN